MSTLKADMLSDLDDVFFVVDDVNDVRTVSIRAAGGTPPGTSVTAIRQHRTDEDFDETREYIFKSADVLPALLDHGSVITDGTEEWKVDGTEDDETGVIVATVRRAHLRA